MTPPTPTIPHAQDRAMVLRQQLADWAQDPTMCTCATKNAVEAAAAARIMTMTMTGTL